MNDKIKELRQEYSQSTLTEEKLEENPFLQFHKWFEEALNAAIPEPHAMTISTVSATGRPSSRIVLMRNMDELGVVFFTNYKSKKGNEVAGNFYAALNFFWQQIERQVRIEGRVEKIAESDSDAYFASRPRESQIGAWASLQSKSIENRTALEKQVLLVAKKYENVSIPRPPHWGGYRVIPDYFEFWQGREGRLHDRICFNLINESWSIKRLNP